MGWAANHIAKLFLGQTVSFKPYGNSMHPKVKSGELVTVVPVTEIDIEVGDIVLCRVAGSDYLHLVKKISKRQDSRDTQYLIGNNHGGENGWITKKHIYGKLI